MAIRTRLAFERVNESISFQSTTAFAVMVSSFGCSAVHNPERRSLLFCSSVFDNPEFRLLFGCCQSLTTPILGCCLPECCLPECLSEGVTLPIFKQKKNALSGVSIILTIS